MGCNTRPDPAKPPVIAGVTAVKGRDAAVKAMTFLLKGLRIPK